MFKSGVKKAQKAKDHVEEALEKVRTKPWATPLGKALKVSGDIVEAVDGFVPGAKYLGGALSFGATLLNPEPTPEDLQDQLRDIKATIEANQGNKFMVQSLQKAQIELEEQIARCFGEIRTEVQDIRVEMKEVYCKVTESSKAAEEKMEKIKGLMGETFDIVVDSRFKVQYSVEPFAWFSSCVSFEYQLHIVALGRPRGG